LTIILSALLFCVPDTGTGQQPAAQPGARPADQAAIDQAIQNGVLYLRSVQNPQTGVWGTGTGPNGDKGWGVGYTALAGIALVECGVPTSDPGLQKAADGVRYYLNDLDSTYEVALAILFLDRMGEKKDRRKIQILAARLIAGQTPSGGWGYKVPKITTEQHEALLQALRKMSPPPPQPIPSARERPGSLGLCIKASDELMFKPPQAFDPEKARTSAISALPANMKRWSVFQGQDQVVIADPKDKNSEPFGATTDNSNTHFATLAMWAARKHDIPVERSLTLLAQRFRNSQGADGTWGYAYARNGGGGSPAFTCVALLGLAIGHVVDPDVAVKPEQDPRVVKAFAWLSGRVGAPVGSTVGRPTPTDAGGLYFMWSMERVAVLYDVGKLDKKDWYQWGAEILLCHQQQDGRWEKGGQHVEHAVLSTSMALLFLRRANLTPDLSRRLTVDTSALTQKVSDTVTPKPTPIPPAPTKAPDPVVTAPAPTPEVVEPKQPTPTPQPPQVRPTMPEPPVASTPAPEKSSSWLWIVLIVVLVLVLGGCAFFYMRMKNGEDEEEKPRKKKRKVKVKAKVQEDEDE
jgi:hypothetical protein